MRHKCVKCGDPATKRCSACTVSTAWYCDTKCQKSDWVAHIFDCNPKREITTADHLALAVDQNLLPEDVQTCMDYGFTRAFTVENRTQLLGLYIGLIKYLGVSPRTLHRWRSNGILVQQIEALYNQLPVQSRGGYYPWFLHNKSILDGSAEPINDPVHDMTLRACRYVGLPDSFSGERVKTILQTWPENKAACFDLCTRLLSRWRPSPFESLWVTFGFCVCPDEFSEGGEAALAQLYQQLIQRASFEELWMAYDKSALLDLINCKGLTSSLLHFPHLTDVLQGSPNGFKSVWYLKQFVISEEGETLSPRLEISVAIDYGFVNCREEIQKQELKGLYKQFFLEASGDPIKLHEACIRGRLFDYVSKLVMLKKDERKMFKSLLKNPYPLPDL